MTMSRGDSWVAEGAPWRASARKERPCAPCSQPNDWVELRVEIDEWASELCCATASAMLWHIIASCHPARRTEVIPSPARRTQSVRRRAGRNRPMDPLVHPPNRPPNLWVGDWAGEPADPWLDSVPRLRTERNTSVLRAGWDGIHSGPPCGWDGSGAAQSPRSPRRSNVFAGGGRGGAVPPVPPKI